MGALVGLLVAPKQERLLNLRAVLGERLVGTATRERQLGVQVSSSPWPLACFEVACRES